MDSSEKPPKKGDELVLSVDSLAFGGKGVARIRGFVIFIEGAVPGDRVLVRITRSKASYAEARTLEVLDPSTTRIEARCQHFGVCGGCSWQTLEYGDQLKYKQRQVRDCLERIGGLSGFQMEEPLPAEPLWRYRNKVEFSFAAAGGGVELGFHLPGRWHQVVDIQDCLLHSEVTNGIRNRVRELSSRTGVPVFDQRRDDGFWRHLVLRESANTGEILVNIVTGSGDFPDRHHLVGDLSELFPEIRTIVWSVNDTRASVAGGFPFTILTGEGYFREHLAGLDLKIPPSAFLQTNTHMAERLYGLALDYASLKGEEFVLDLYSGIGSIALLLSGRCRHVLAVESMEEASRQAEENASINGLDNVTFVTGKVRQVLRDLQLDSPPDVVVLDPPRAGASKKEMTRIIELGAARIVYVSCNASTMAGNARQLVASGYQLTRVRAVDMFPHTPHIETVARFDLQ